MFFNSWADIARTLIVGSLAYFGLLMILRISGKRTLSKMNAFDLIVTVALGSTLATALLSKQVSLSESLTAFATLVALQFIITWLSIKSSTIRNLVKAEPTLLYYDDHFIESALRQQRVTREEIYAAVRAQGIPRLEAVEAVVLETDGSFNVLSRPQTGETATALKYVGNLSDVEAAPLSMKN
jgi:uncharacterized membrane protein YcaP (DUF421 family)